MGEKTEWFYVYASHRDKRPPSFVPAKYLLDPVTGLPVKDPNWGKHFFGDNGKRSDVDRSDVYYNLYANQKGSKLYKRQNVDGYYIVPENYDVDEQLVFGKSIASWPKTLKKLGLAFYFRPGGMGDLQRTYDSGLYGHGFVRAFTDIGAYNYGIVAREAGLILDDALDLAGGGNWFQRYGYIPSLKSPNPTIDTKGLYGDSE